MARRGGGGDDDVSAVETQTRLQVSREFARSLAARDSRACVAGRCGLPPPRACVKQHRPRDQPPA